MKGQTNWTAEDDSRTLRLTTILEQEEVDHTLSGTHHRTTAGLGAQTDWNWKTIVVTLGLRGDHTTDFDFNPGISSGLSMDIFPHWQVMANAGYTLKYQRDNSHILQLSFFRSDTSNSMVYQRGADLIYRPLNVDSSWRHGLELTIN